MMRRRSKVAALTPEERAARATRARRRFRAAARLAYDNQFWLEDLSDMKLGDNVAKNIRLLTQKTKKKSKFTLEEKMIMNTAKDKRTEDEKRILHRVLAGLKCFQRYPNSVKEQLSEVTYFTYIPPKRVVVRQDDEASALFFLLAGEVVVHQRVFDKVLNEWVTNEVGNRQSGSMFGEVSLLHGVRRTATVTTTDHCELLILRKADFDSILKSSVMAEWDNVQQCMSLFSYFDNWDDITIRDCCILSKIKYYGIDDIVLSGDTGDKKFVYFLVKGQCELVEYLDVEVSEFGCKRKYKLLEGKEDEVDTEKDKLHEISHVLVLEGEMSATSNISMYQVDQTVSALLMAKEKGKKKQKKKPYSHDVVEKSVHTYFVKVATFNRLAAFNIGETFVRRFIVASKRTKILLIPRYWLVQKNKEIWNHVKQFMNQRLPDTKNVFNDFVQQKKWHDYKKNLVEEIISNSKKVNLNNIHNVPYSIRMQEDLSFYECNRRRGTY